jgi:uncharacterized protein (UPF0335 family)
MTTTTEVGTTQARLKNFVSRLERLGEDLDSVKGDIREVFKEAKNEGFDTKALGKVLRLLKKSKDERDQEQALLETYLHALEG